MFILQPVQIIWLLKYPVLKKPDEEKEVKDELDIKNLS